MYGTESVLELKSLQMKSTRITDESLESTRRMVYLCEESHGAGSRTIDMLERQGEQLKLVAKQIDTLDNEIKEAEKHISGMEKWCGLCLCPWNRTQYVEDCARWPGNDELPSSLQKVTHRPMNIREPKMASPYINRINHDAREDEMEENMQMVGSMLDQLRYMAIDMGEEVEQHQHQLAAITAKAEAVDVRINVANQRTEKLLK